MSSNNTPIPAEGSKELIPQFRADDDVATIASALLEQGLVVVHRGVEFADALTADGAFDQILDTTKASGGGGSFLPSNTKRTTALVTRMPEQISDLVLDALTLALCDATIKKNCDSYQIHGGPGALVIGPGAEAQLLHTEDRGLVRYIRRAFQTETGQRPDLILACMTAISEFTPENGGTHVVPGSHRWDLRREAQPHEVVAAAIPRGSQLFWLGTTLHAAGPNLTTDVWRKGIVTTYSVGWVRRETEHLNEIPSELANELDPRLRFMLGFGTHGALGGYDPRHRKVPRAMAKMSKL